MTRDGFTDFPSSQQVAFTKGIGDPELQMVRSQQLVNDYQVSFKTDISMAYDTVDKEAFLYLMKEI